jgi:hypothetical protein
VRTETGHSRLASSTELAGGEELGGYRIVQRRGPSTADVDLRGFSMAAVLYVAEEISTGRSVLLKVFKRELKGEESFVKRFLREGRRVAAFQHPNVASVYDVGLERGHLYLAAEDLEGETLSSLLRSGGLPAARTTALLGPIADALDAAHDAGLVHGDVRPETIRIDADGVPRLAAFRVAKLPARISIAGVRAGNVDYAPPEQLCEQPLTATTDVYSRTGVLYRCLTGELPFSEHAPVEEIDFDNVPSLGWFEPARPRLDRVIARGMANDPADRYERARELIEEAEEALGQLPIELLERAPTFLPIARDEGLQRRRRIGVARTALIAALAVAAIAAFFGASALKGSSSDRGHPLASAGPLTVRYDRSWQAASGAVTGAFAVTGSNAEAAPVALTSGFATVAAGVLRQSAPVPGDVPPQLAARYGRPLDSGAALIAGHAARRYEWTVPGGTSVVVFVLPTTGSDIALICAGSAPTEPALNACEQLADEAQVSGTSIIPPGPDRHIAAALSRDLAPVAVSLDALHGLGEQSLLARSVVAANVARVEREAQSSLSHVTAPARNSDALSDLRSALSAEESAFAGLASAAASNNSAAYDDARLRAIATSKLLIAAEATMTLEGFKPPSLFALTLDAAPAPSPPPPPSLPQHRSEPAPSLGSSIIATPVGPEQVVPSAPEVHSSPPPSTPDSTPQPPPPNVVVVPTGSAKRSQSPSIVVVPTG